jgi:hypothetical protein
MVKTPNGWQVLTRDEHERAWTLFEATFQFHPSVNPSHWPSITEPEPSVTWDLALDRAEVADPRRNAPWTEGVVYERVNAVLIAAWTSLLTSTDWLYVLDWQHPGYRCWPHRVDEPTIPNNMPVDVFPNGDYYIFLSPDLRLGTFGHPWEASLCVWGDQLLSAVEAVDRDCLTRVLRRNGTALTSEP